MFSKSKLLFWVAVTATIVAVCVTGKDDDDVSDRIFGLFDLQTSMAEDDFEDVMKEMEFSEKDRETAKNAKGVTVEIRKDGRKYFYIVRAPGRTFESKFENGKPFVDKLFDGRKHNATITLKASTATRDETHEKFTCHHVAVFYDDGFEVTYSVTKNGKTTTAKQTFNRRKPGDIFGIRNLFGGR